MRSHNKSNANHLKGQADKGMVGAIARATAHIHDPLRTGWYDGSPVGTTGAPPIAAMAVHNKSHNANAFYHYTSWATLCSAALLLSNPDSAARFASWQPFLDALTTSLSGYRHWQNQPPYHPRQYPNILWQDGSSQLVARQNGPVESVLLPSMINGPEVLDLVPQLSFYDAINAARPSAIFHWGEVGFDERDFSIDDYFDRLARAITANAQPVHLIGYCMGGTLALDFAARYPQLVQSVTTIGAPINFHHDQGQIAIFARQIAAMTATEQAQFFAPFGAAFGVLPGIFVQHLFAMLNPLQLTEKFRINPLAADNASFHALEAWINHPVDLPINLTLELCDRWIRRNQPIRKDIPANIPVLAVCSTRDHIAPPASTHPISHIAPHAQIKTYNYGHVGLLIGTKARKNIWPQLCKPLITV